VYKTFGPSPGQLAIVRRQNPENIDNLPKTVPELFERDWRLVADVELDFRETLALIAHDTNGYAPYTLAQIFGYEADHLLEAFRRLTFLRAPLNRDCTFEFISESYRKFACSKLADLWAPARDRVIAWLLDRPESSEALSMLPGPSG
jgi:hypothetical protein